MDYAVLLQFYTILNGKDKEKQDKHMVFLILPILELLWDNLLQLIINIHNNQYKGIQDISINQTIQIYLIIQIFDFTIFFY